jgi:UDP-N-acetylmuramoyl-tripeptide--D-alanyl-D-alanine ligase
MLKKIASKIVVRQLRRYVQRLISAHDLTVIMITGTVGKTSTKMAIGKTLELNGRKVCYSQDSYNTEVGVPLALFGMKAPERVSSPTAWRAVFRQMSEMIADYPYDLAILEIAEDERAMMLPWVRLMKPTIGVLSGVSPAHMERFSSLETLRDDAITLVSEAKTVFYDADFDVVREVMERRKGAVSYGLKKGLVRFENIVRTPSGRLNGDLVMGKERLVVRSQLIAEHGLSSLLAAACVGREMGVSTPKIAGALGKITTPVGRMRLLEGVNGSTLIDDSYNSSPAAVKAGLDALMDIDGRSHIAVLGSMNELGVAAADLHREIGEYAASKNLDMLVTVGKVAGQYIGPSAEEAGMERTRIKQFRTPYEAGHYLKKHIAKNDVVFVKGSQNGVFTEETSRILLAPGQIPTQVLVRQSKFWKRKKKKSFGL